MTFIMYYMLYMLMFYILSHKKLDMVFLLLFLYVLLLFELEQEVLLSFKSFSFPFMYLTYFIFINMLLSLYQYTTNKTHNMTFLTIMLSMLLFLLFMSESYYSFFLFYEMTILPTMLLISQYGNSVFRWEATIYFFLFTMISSMFLFLFLFYISNYGEKLVNSFSNNHFINSNYVEILNLLIFLTFLVKFPMFFFHMWLPKAHVEAPTIGSMVLAGVLLKMGGFGMFMFNKFNFFSSSFMLSMICSFILWGSMLIGMNCYSQSDIKVLIAYSSVSHMSLALFGFLLNFSGSIMGSLYIMLGHGFVSSLLFYMSSLFYLWGSNRSFFSTSQMENNLSISIYFYYIITMMISAGFPPFLNFIGEIILFTFIYSMLPFMFFIFLHYVMNIVYTITMMSHLFHNKKNKNIFSSCKSSLYLSLIIINMHLMPMMFLMNIIMFY